MTLIGLYVCYLLVLPFLPALAWALAVAVLAAPLHRRLENRLRRPNLSAAISVALLALLVFMPLILLAQQLFGVLSTGATAVQNEIASGDLQRTVEAHPLFARISAAIDGQTDLATVVGHVGAWLTNLGTSIARGSLSNVITVVLTFYLLFYFLRDRGEPCVCQRRFPR